MMEIKNLVSEISNELAIAILVEKRHREALEKVSPKEFIGKISETLEDGARNCEDELEVSHNSSLGLH